MDKEFLEDIRKSVEDTRENEKEGFILLVDCPDESNEKITIKTFLKGLDEIYEIHKEYDVLPFTVLDKKYVIAPVDKIKDKRFTKCIKEVPSFVKEKGNKYIVKFNEKYKY